MAQKTLFLLSTDEPFITGSANLSVFKQHLYKLEGAAILLCLGGEAKITLDLKQYNVKKNTQVVLLPGTVLSINEISKDFRVDFFVSHGEMFREACHRLESTFFHFLKENPCYLLPEHFTANIKGFLSAATSIYNDSENRFRNQIARNHLQSFLLDVYDKAYRFFTSKEIEGYNRQDELFKKFMTLIHDHCATQREVGFYADRLCISAKYLTNIVRATTGDSAKKVIDDFSILELKVLLQSSELTIQEIADQLNFPDQSYLGRYFKRHEGISPMEYRNRSARNAIQI